MTAHLDTLPSWVALLIALFILLGTGLTLIGSLGLLRLESFYDRLHAPTLGTTLGVTFLLAASVICFSVLQTRVVVHEILISIFIVMTVPVSLILLVRTALYRDHQAEARKARPDDT